MSLELPPPDALRYILYQSMQSICAPGFDTSFSADLCDANRHCVDAEIDPNKTYDAVFLILQEDPDCAQKQMEEARACLSEYGYYYLFYTSLDCLIQCQVNTNLIFYAAWQSNPHGLIYQDSDHLSEETGLVMAVSGDYNPVAHVRSLYEKIDKLGWAYQILINIHDEKIPDLEIRGHVAAEKLFCLLQYDKKKDSTGRINRLSRAFDEFYKATTYIPSKPAPYLTMGKYLERQGRPDLAKRYMTSLNHIHQDPALAQLEERFTTTMPVFSDTFPPEWSGKKCKILYLLQKQSDYGSDTIYDGLCDLLGDEAVVEYPWKPTLHGHEPEKAFGYPCVFERGGEAQVLEGLCAALRAGEFDLVVYSDPIRTLDQDEIKALIQAAGETPIFLMDMCDRCGDYFDEIQEFIGAKKIKANFKREKLHGVAYGDNTVALPFGFKQNNTPIVPWDVRDELFFWAGSVQAGTRRLCLEYLHTAFNMNVNRKLSPEQYANTIARSRMGLSLIGNGFDTVRYWELPAYGCCMFSETLPIEIPHNFQDGREAIFFDDLKSLEEKLDYYLAHQDEVQRIASAGLDHFNRHHTATARARHLLGWAESFINRD